MVQQVKDDVELLNLMIADAEDAPAIFQPTNYWSVYIDRINHELRTKGLHDFRKREAHTLLQKFGAVDINVLPINLNRWVPYKYHARGIGRLTFKFFEKILNAIPMQRNFQHFFAYEKQQVNNTTAKPLEAFEASLVGNPGDVFTIGGKKYPCSLINYYQDYLYTCSFIDYSQVNLFIELGSGSGKQIEILKKLYPHICFLVFDIPTQLYVCEQYLSAVFPDDVISYRSTRNMTRLPADRAGKIIMFGNWRFPIIEKEPVDLFWNNASFQEMEPDVVSTYLHSVSLSSRAVFLGQEMRGKVVANQKGKVGVMEKTTLEHYQKCLDQFELLDISEKKMLITPLRGILAQNTFWRKKQIDD